MVGVVAPIVRGENNIRADFAARGKQVDIVIMGHWHQYMTPKGVIVNGALKGFDEFAKGHRFSVELPQQALWFTHPRHGITFQCPVFLEDYLTNEDNPWVAVQ